ncbi:MAG: hypothetical protein ISS88_03290 [Candidatus Portnoybacteria bacterium]|nr:hypothetical protein [Candidatus Portnoybacteria bacterium]
MTKIKQYKTRLNQNLALIGMILGDGSMMQPNMLYIRHGGKQLDYVDEKVCFLKNYIKPTSLRSAADKQGYKYRYAYYYDNSKLPYFYKMIYKNGRKTITQELLNHFNGISLSFFYMDDGCLAHRKYRNKNGEWTGGYRSREIYLCTHSFIPNEVRMFIKMLKNKFDLSFRMTMDKGHPRIWCNTKNTKKMLEIVKPVVSQFKTMSYKLDLKYQNGRE